MQLQAIFTKLFHVMEQMLIRRATIKDAEFISLLARVTFNEAFSHLFEDKHELYNYYHRAFSVPKVRASLQDENNVFLLAINEDLPIGYAKLKKFAPTPYIESTRISQLQHIYLLQDFIAKRIGQHLINELFEEAARLQNDYLWLSVYKENQRAIRFYENKDFKAIGNDTFRIGKQSFDFIVLKKELS
jgi:ribosomal protein S18 acetylase RimI-like enzyme